MQNQLLEEFQSSITFKNDVRKNSDLYALMIRIVPGGIIPFLCLERLCAYFPLSYHCTPASSDSLRSWFSNCLYIVISLALVDADL